MLCFPRKQEPQITVGFRKQIIAALATRYGKTSSIVRRNFFDENVEFWGKIRRLEGGDTMHASKMGKSENLEDSRDNSFIWVSQISIILM